MDKDKKDRINKRKIAYIYLMHRMFEGNPAMMLRILGNKPVTVEDLQDWDIDYKEAVYQTIREEDMKGVPLKDPEAVPSIKGIKEKVLRRVDVLITATDDPARLAQVYKTLSEYEVADDKKEKSVLDAINESIKPLTPKKKEAITMLEKMKQEGRIPESGKRRGRPKKAKQETDPLKTGYVIPEAEEEIEEEVDEEPIEEETEE